jgi:hypothetical protein
MRSLCRGLFVLAAFCAFAQDAAERSIGVWKLNVQKSDLSAVANPAVSAIQKVEKVGPKKYRETFDIVLKDGQKQHNENLRTYDGQERQREGQAAGITETCAVLDANAVKCTNRRDGKVTGEVVATISADGKTMTGRFTVIRDGKQISGVRVYDKQ